MSKTYSSHHTKKDIALCFGERTGLFVDPKEIRVRGDWLFYKSPDYDEIDCYRAAHARSTLVYSAWNLGMIALWKSLLLFQTIMIESLKH